ncbi:XRE family transcriptional regulator [Bacillus sp. AFS015802]|uniref:helix-turn-helix domain-containing protein n=1 Tax=Bacillus sp. AFS015802 TaxID=2033486 RepID=UPI000BF94817|nr:helix-turn-helix domain-containing protein [Bacillus sp. AFS015802]PFA67313.1 XRE family transcriptional regulator [Bacillus sp. AFS015802]
MDYSVIGKKIKELRKGVQLTQGELAEGICTQALISRIEKGDIYPSATALYQISKKLGVDVNYFFEIGTTPRLDYVQEVERQLRKLRVKHHYEEMMDIVKVEEKNPIFNQTDFNSQLLLWHRAIYTQEVLKDKVTARILLHEALGLTYDHKKALSEREMEIMLSLGVIDFSEENYDGALKYYEQVKNGLKGSKQLHDKAIKTRLLYNIARLYTRLERYEKSNENCKEAIRWSINEENMYALGHLHYHVGYNYELLKQYQKALPYFEKAILIFELQDEHVYLDYLRKRKEGLISRVQNT